MSIITAAVLVVLLGVLADVVAAAIRRLGHRSPSWWEPFRRFRADVRLLVRDRDRASVVEAGGAGAALAGAALAGAAAVGAITGTLASLYLSLLLVAAASHAAAATPLTTAGARRAVAARLDAVLAEPALLLALGVAFARWHTSSLEAIRGAHRVLGTGLQVGATTEAVGLGLAAGTLLIAGTLRLPPEPGREAGAHGGTSAALAVARWAAMGVIPLVGASLLWSRVPAAGAGWPFELAHLPVVGAAGVGAVVVGVIRGGLAFGGRGVRVSVATLAVALVAVGAGMVSSG